MIIDIRAKNAKNNYNLLEFLIPNAKIPRKRKLSNWFIFSITVAPAEIKPNFEFSRKILVTIYAIEKFWSFFSLNSR